MGDPFAGIDSLLSQQKKQEGDPFAELDSLEVDSSQEESKPDHLLELIGYNPITKDQTSIIANTPEDQARRYQQSRRSLILGVGERDPRENIETFSQWMDFIRGVNTGDIPTGELPSRMVDGQFIPGEGGSIRGLRAPATGPVREILNVLGPLGAEVSSDKSLVENIAQVTENAGMMTFALATFPMFASLHALQASVAVENPLTTGALAWMARNNAGMDYLTEKLVFGPASRMTPYEIRSANRAFQALLATGGISRGLASGAGFATNLARTRAAQIILAQQRAGVAGVAQLEELRRIAITSKLAVTGLAPSMGALFGVLEGEPGQKGDRAIAFGIAAIPIGMVHSALSAVGRIPEHSTQAGTYSQARAAKPFEVGGTTTDPATKMNVFLKEDGDFALSLVREAVAVRKAREGGTPPATDRDAVAHRLLGQFGAEPGSVGAELVNSPAFDRLIDAMDRGNKVEAEAIIRRFVQNEMRPFNAEQLARRNEADDAALRGPQFPADPPVATGAVPTTSPSILTGGPNHGTDLAGAVGIIKEGLRPGSSVSEIGGRDFEDYTVTIQFGDTGELTAYSSPLGPTMHDKAATTEGRETQIERVFFNAEDYVWKHDAIAAYNAIRQALDETGRQDVPIEGVVYNDQTDSFLYGGKVDFDAIPSDQSRIDALSDNALLKEFDQVIDSGFDAMDAGNEVMAQVKDQIADYIGHVAERRGLLKNPELEAGFTPRDPIQPQVDRDLTSRIMGELFLRDNLQKKHPPSSVIRGIRDPGPIMEKIKHLEGEMGVNFFVHRRPNGTFDIAIC